MPIDLACSCGKKLRARDEHAGKQLKCPACGGVLTIPRALSASAGGPSAPPTSPVPVAAPPADGKATGPEAMIRANRYQRWYVLTGGSDPAIHSELPKVLLKAPADKNLRLADLVFTNLGLLIVPFQNVEEFGERGPMLGLQGLLSEKWSKHKAHQHYQQHAPRHRSLTLLERYREPVDPADRIAFLTPLGEFLPADEIEALTQTRGWISFTFRGKGYSFALTDPNTPASLDHAIKWQKWASYHRRALSGGPPSPNLVALLEWGQRPVDKAPSWVERLIAHLATQREKLEIPKNPFGEPGIPTQHVVDLVRRLRSLAVPQASAVAVKVQAAMLKAIKSEFLSAIVMMVFGIPAILCLVFLIRHGNEVKESALGYGTAVDVTAFIFCLISAIALCGGVWKMAWAVWASRTVRQAITENR